MCGIAGIHRTTAKPVPKINDLANQLLLAIEKRGTDATGYLALMHDGRVQLEKRTLPAHTFVAKRGRIAATAKTVLLHTRFATVGRREDPANAHPVASGKVAAIHNGTIYNATALFAKHSLKRVAEVDSEIVPALVNALGWDKAKEAIAQFDGGAALGIIHTDHTDEVILARTRGYPLSYMVTNDLVVWASTEDAIRRAWRAVYPRKAFGTFHTLPDYHMARVNGSVTVTKIKDPPKVVQPYRTTGYPSGYGRFSQGRTTLPPATSKRSRKKARKAARSNVPAVAGASAGWIETPNDGLVYVGVVQAISYEALLDAGLTPTEAMQVLDEERDMWDTWNGQDWDDPDYDPAPHRWRGDVITKSESTLMMEALERGER